MKTVILSAVIITSIVLGVHGRNTEIQRMRALGSIKRLLLSLKRSLQFSAVPVKTAICEVILEEGDVITPFINALKISSEESFSKVWTCSFLEFNQEKHLFSKEEASLILSFGKNFGNSDISEQLELIDMTANYFDEYEKRARLEYKSRGKLKMALPLYAGFIICILMI